MSVTLILGGARSGKSARAQALAEAASRSPVYLATSRPMQDDAEWQARIAHHRAARGAHWRLVEEPLALADTLERLDGEVVVVDCLTLWLANLMQEGRDVAAETAALCGHLARGPAGAVLLVSNEVGMGLAPESALGRSFRDAQGRLNQAVAAVADRVEFVAAGLPLVLKEKAKEGVDGGKH